MANYYKVEQDVTTPTIHFEGVLITIKTHTHGYGYGFCWGTESSTPIHTPEKPMTLTHGFL